MIDEIQSLEKNGTWELMDLHLSFPPEKKDLSQILTTLRREDNQQNSHNSSNIDHFWRLWQNNILVETV